MRGTPVARSLLSKITEPFYARLALWYQAEVAKELQKTGLRYDDLLDPLMNLDVAEALKRLPQEEVDLRNQRLKRALDHSMKHTELEPEMKAKQTPYLFYVDPVQKEIEAENVERYKLGIHKPYMRQLP